MLIAVVAGISSILIYDKVSKEKGPSSDNSSEYIDENTIEETKNPLETSKVMSMDNADAVNVNRPSISKVGSGSRGKLTVAWSEEHVDGYEVQYATSSSFEKAVVIDNEGDRRTSTISKLTPGTIYYVRVRAYMEVDGVKHYSKWSNIKNAKVS